MMTESEKYTGKLLVIDDEAPILEILEISLASEGYDVVTAQNGVDGIRAFEEHGIKLVLTDIRMPGMDGIEILKEIKAKDKEAEVIVITGHGDMDAAVSAIRHGASDFITKPIRDDILTLALKRAENKINLSRKLKDYTNHLEDKVQACRLELVEAQRVLIEKERLATIGETVARLAHFIKNILTGLKGGRYMVNRGMEKNDSKLVKDGWAMVDRNIERVSDLVLDFLRYTKEREPERSMCRPNEIVEDAVQLYREKAKEHGIALRIVQDERMGEAFLDRNTVYDVLLNLISNAIDACVYDSDTSKAWEVVVKSRLSKNDAGREMIVFEVSDNGLGMSEEVKDKLFTRFFSTKGGKGTGLGLLVTRKMIEEHGGSIAVKSTEGLGSTFIVQLKKEKPEGSAPSR
jgi:signal transduction histidine kinase